jgi:ABC-2 type transport system permease protein
LTATALALRLGRWGIAGFSVLTFFSSYVQAVGFYQLAGHTRAERAAFAQSMTQLAAQLNFILAPPVRLDTVGGYVEWRSFGGLAILFGVWALVSASGAARGDEERGVVESVLAASLARLGWLASRVTGFFIAGLIAALAGGLGLVAGAAGGGDSVGVGPLVEMALALGALGLSCYSLTLLIAQLTGARIATAAAGVVLLALFLVDRLSTTFTWLVSWRWLSPFHYYELNHPLAPGGAFDLRATLTMFGIALAAAAAAVVVFEARDLGSSFLRWPARPHPVTYEPSRSLVWRIAVVRGLYERRAGLAIWAAGLAGVAALFVSLTKTVLQPLLSIPAFTSFMGGFAGAQLYTSFLGYFWLTFAELLVAGFAIAQVARWSAEDTDGRLELVLSNPMSRAAVVVERAVVLTFGALFVAAISEGAALITAHYQGMDVSTQKITEASLLLVPFALVFAAAGSVLAAWNPRAAVGLLGAFAFASYLVAEVGTILKWPTWVQNASAFKLFGTPLSSGVDRAGLLTMLAIIVVGFGASILVMERRDVGA